GLRFGSMQFDNVFGGLVLDADGWCRASIEDPSTLRRLTIECDEAVRECVVYAPADRAAICMEPFTCAPVPIRLKKLGVDGGLRVLAPGESLSARIQLSVT